MADSTRHLTLDEVVERIEARSIPEPNSGCLLWDSVAEVNSRGDTRPQYARVRLRGKMVLIHRVIVRGGAWSYPTRTAVFPCIGAMCPLCCEPTHLFLGTNDENHRDKALKLIRREEEVNHREGEEICMLHQGGLGPSELARRYGLSQGYVSNLVSGKKRPLAALPTNQVGI